MLAITGFELISIGLSPKAFVLNRDRLFPNKTSLNSIKRHSTSVEGIRVTFSINL